MAAHYFEDEHFQKLNFTEQGKNLTKGDYENCTFSHCLFTNADVSEMNFMDCTFNHCDFSSALIKNTIFQQVVCKNCKFLGVDFDSCSDFLFSISFDNCLLELASFYQCDLQNTTFKDCNLREVDFRVANLTKVVFNNCQLERAIFEHSILEKTDFRTAYQFSIDPSKNKVKKTRFTLTNVVGLLSQYDIVID